MKFMKLGSKPDSFQSKGDNVRYVATELATEIVVNIGDIRFYLHKFPLLSKSGLFKKLITTSLTEENLEEINISEIPGGPAAFEICVKFCYGITVTLNAYNVIAARCAAEFLEMNETTEKSNLIYKIEVFLNSTIFHSWKDSIIVLQTTRSLNSSQELKFKLVKRCLDAIALIASIDTMKVNWSYTYSKKKLEKGINGVRKQEAVPKDWWVEDLCDLHIDLYKQVISTIQSKQKVPANVIGEALEAYAVRKLPGFSKGSLITDIAKYRCLIDSILELIPDEKGSVSFGFLSKLLKAVNCLECCDENVKERLKKRVCLQLEEAAVSDLLVFDVDMVLSLVMEFLKRDLTEDNVGNVMKGLVAKVVDGYLSEKSRDDSSFDLQMFVSLAETVSGFPRESHDGLYRAIDMFLKENPEINKSEKKRICRLMDCRKLSAEACAHAVQNERLPMRVIVQVLFFEQIRSNNNNNNNGSSSTGNTTPELIPVSRSTTTTINTEDDWHQD